MNAEREMKDAGAVAVQQQLAVFQQAVAGEHIVIGRMALDGMAHLLRGAAAGDPACKAYVDTFLVALDAYRMGAKIVIPGASPNGRPPGG